MLKEWVQILLKNRDVMQQSITGFENVNGDFIVHRSTGDELFLIRPEANDVNEIVQKTTGKTGLVVLNTRKNLEFVIANWDKLAQLKGLCIYFANPAANEKWLLYPHTHNLITEKAALRRGLEAMFVEVAAVG